MDFINIICSQSQTQSFFYLSLGHVRVCGNPNQGY